MSNETYVHFPNDEYEVVSAGYCSAEWLPVLQQNLVGKSHGPHYTIESVRFEPSVEGSRRGNIIYRCVPLWKNTEPVVTSL